MLYEEELYAVELIMLSAHIFRKFHCLQNNQTNCYYVVNS